MNASQTKSASTISLLHELFAAATREASDAMAGWTGGLITLTLDEVCELPLEEVGNEFDFGDDLVTMVVMNLPGDLGGDMILVFDETSGRQLASSLLSKPVGEDEQWSPLEESALCETGNILSCAYVNAISKLLDQRLVPAPPQFIQDYGASVLQQALMAQAMACDQVLVCRTAFQRNGENIEWYVFFVPTPAMREAIDDALEA